MRKLLRWIGTALLFLAIAICLAPSLVPPFLDRIYYRGPPSGHYDGERFFNPGPIGAGFHGGPARFLNRMLGDDQRAQWPEHVPVTSTVPPRSVAGEEMRVTWIGHATVLVQTQGLNILTDPVWSDVVSPFPPVGPSRVRAPGVRFEDLPKIDLVLISHNHYDHMDLPTLKRLWERDRPLIVTSLGNDSVMRNGGVPALALEWGRSQYVAPGCVQIQSPGGVANYPDIIARMECAAPGATVTVERNHHWSSRWGTDRNRALWSAFTVQLPGGNLFFAGDTGWGGGRWVRQAARRGPFRFAIIPIGAYEPRDTMRGNHIDPDEAVGVFQGVGAAYALGIHWGTFQLTFEAIDDPPRRLSAALRRRGIPGGRFIATEVGRTFSVPTLAARR
jgi:L-ascorbate metabolism protein UlaG (beta-lactamase superfamily)